MKTLILFFILIPFFCLAEEPQDLAKALKEAKTVPVLDGNGKVKGYKLVKIKNGSVYQKIGLKEGDVIKNINAEQVDSPQKAMELYQKLKRSHTSQMEVANENNDVDSE